jgi:hypothetical protein
MLPPVVTSMSPTSGGYGTEITIAGERFTEIAKLLEFVSGDGSVGELDSHEWSPTLIRARLPFPFTASGELSFCSATDAPIGDPGCRPGQTRTVAGSFSVESDWQPGRAEIFAGGILGGRVLSDGSVAVVSQGDGAGEGPRLFVFGGDEVAPHSIPGLPDRPRRVVVLEGADGSAEVVASSDGSVFHHRFDGDTFESVNTGIAGSVVAGGSDDLGRFVWVSFEGLTTRLRVDEDFGVDRTVTFAASNAAIAHDGTLIIARIEPVGNLLDERYRLQISSLAPDAETPEPLGEASVQSYDSIPWVGVEVSGDGQVVVVSFCGEDGGQTHCNYRRVRDAEGAWSDPPKLPFEAVLSVGESGLISVYPDERGLIVHDLTTDDVLVIPVWPAMPLALLGEPTNWRPLVRRHFEVFAPRGLP